MGDGTRACSVLTVYPPHPTHAIPYRPFGLFLPCGLVWPTCVNCDEDQGNILWWSVPEATPAWQETIPLEYIEEVSVERHVW